MDKKRETDLFEILKKILKRKNYQDISTILNISISTMKRWEDKKQVPFSYAFEIMKLQDKKIDYSKFSFSEKDQFFTPLKTAQYCFENSKQIMSRYGDDIKNYVMIEPSAGNGVFFNLFPKERRVGMDIEPRNSFINQKDFLDWKPDDVEKKYIIIGNPPFGLRGQLALKFINHSAPFADYVCFILPQLFESDGKGSPRKRVKGFHLVHSEPLHTYFEDPNGKKVQVQCIFQVWSKFHKNSSFDVSKVQNQDIKIYSVSDGGTPSSTRNKNMHNECHIFLPSTVYGKENMKCFFTFQDLPKQRGYGLYFTSSIEKYITICKKIDWSQIAFLSTNSAYNLRTSKIIEAINKYSSL